MSVILSFVTQAIGTFPCQRIACSLSFSSVFIGWPGLFKRLTRMSLKWSKVSLRLDPTTFSFTWKHIVRRGHRAAWKQFHKNIKAYLIKLNADSKFKNSQYEMIYYFNRRVVFAVLCSHMELLLLIV